MDGVNMCVFVCVCVFMMYKAKFSQMYPPVSWGYVVTLWPWSLSLCQVGTLITHFL